MCSQSNRHRAKTAGDLREQAQRRHHAPVPRVINRRPHIRNSLVRRASCENLDSSIAAKDMASVMGKAERRDTSN